MAATATLERKPSAKGGGTAPAKPKVPFVRASHRHVEGAFFDVSQLVGAASVQLGPYDVPSYGFLRYIVLLVTCTGGALGGGAVTADFPFNILQEISLTDPNGSNVVYPFTGYQLYLANKYGAYVWSSDPTAAPDYDATIVTTQFMLRIPVEITPWDGFGALANQNAASAYKVRLTVSPLATIATGGAPVAPTVRVRGYLEAWSAPAQFDLLQQPQETQPPALGTTQFWSPYMPVVAAGQQQIRLSRVGNLIRNLILVMRTAAGARSNAVGPDPISVNWDSAALINSEPVTFRRKRMYEQSNAQPETGVIVYSFTDDQDGHNGFENRHLWLPTVQATRLEIVGVFQAAGVMEVLTNDVAVTPLGR